MFLLVKLSDENIVRILKAGYYTSDSNLITDSHLYSGEYVRISTAGKNFGVEIPIVGTTPVISIEDLEALSIIPTEEAAKEFIKAIMPDCGLDISAQRILPWTSEELMQYAGGIK